MKLIDQYMTIFFNLAPTSNHLHPLQVENCDSNSRLVVDEMTMVNSGLKGLSVDLLSGQFLILGFKMFSTSVIWIHFQT